MRHQIAGIDEKVALLVFRERPQGGDGVAGGGAVFGRFLGQRERRAVGPAGALAVDHIGQRVGAVSRHCRQCEGAAQIQMRVVFPGEADAAVQLNVVLRVEDLAVHRLGGGDGRAEPGVVQIVGAGRVPRCGGGEFGRHQHVGGMVFDGLERADGAAELLAHLGVLDGHLQRRPADPDGFGGGQNAKCGVRLDSCIADDGDGLGLVQRHRADAAGGVRAVQWRDGDAGGLGVDDHHVVTGDEDQKRGVGGAQHRRALAEHGVAGDVNVARQSQGGDGAAVGQPGQQRGAQLFGSAPVDDDAGGDGRQERPGAQFAALRLEHHGQLGQPETGAAVRFGDRQALPPQIGRGRPETVRMRRPTLERGAGGSPAAEPVQQSRR
ncbi:Uncharacterised protein [Mycobacteroides abscessus subsp. abscessus]|nr:Uncharacterised protein [Mycobacteroides abscessus subsp. abscessus]